MKTIILYTRRNVGIYALNFLKAKGFDVKVITDDLYVEKAAAMLDVKKTSFARDWGEYELFLCVHGNRIIPKEYLVEGKFVNIHPCLEKYKGHNPVRRYIDNKDTMATVASHYMTERVDDGEIIVSSSFYTGQIQKYAEFYNIAAYYYFECINATLNKLNIYP